MGNNSYIPGVFGNSDSSEAIKKIMETKTKKLEELKEEKNDITKKQETWNNLKAKTLSLESTTKKLYGFEAPFDNKISVSSDENAFSANVTKQALIGEHSVEIIQKAQSHKIASNPLSDDFIISSGEYEFIVGKNKIKFSFSIL